MTEILQSPAFQWAVVAMALAAATLLHSTSRKDQAVATALFFPSSLVPVAMFSDWTFVLLSATASFWVLFWGKRWAKYWVGTGSSIAAVSALSLDPVSAVHRTLLCVGTFGATTALPKVTLASQFAASFTAAAIFYRAPEPIMLAWVAVPVVAYLSPKAKAFIASRGRMEVTES